MPTVTYAIIRVRNLTTLPLVESANPTTNIQYLGHSEDFHKIDFPNVQWEVDGGWGQIPIGADKVFKLILTLKSLESREIILVIAEVKRD